MVAVDEGKRRGLGRGLSALFGEEGEVPESGDAAGDGLRTAPVGHLSPGPYQHKDMLKQPHNQP